MRNIFISDFDETITSRDTIEIIAELPYLLKSNFKPKWSHFVQNYMEGFDNLYDANLHKRKLPLIKIEPSFKLSTQNYRKLLDSEFAFQSFNALIELNSIEEISRYSVFKDITVAQMKDYATSKLIDEPLLLRKDFTTLAKLKIKKEDFYVVSVNWSTEFISEILKERLLSEQHIFCNNLLVEGEKYTGEFSNKLLTGSDKVTVLEDLLADLKLKEEGTKYWYIGDSETDLLCILHPRVNGVLLLDPKHKRARFDEITLKILGLPIDEINEFCQNDRVHYLKFDIKEGNNALYLIKSWESFDRILTDENIIT
ncbi:hypothetical protein KAFR_0H03020 [Kazachstania africana CBS 2517]|uniref:Haloacid dehalogenase-like hydrolase n=1 Tax=Kazachstania africana (strain ATCC 22294 / BCRC 22015 / CBS 2517 / CECT 1963 / NBRC 1671 / NRRL Y-8276) TaxID=1071382 RepID=H2AZF6_KAZAF|nr:hypothetical protein KAFR_0H03020 [Kazachstania africana CBS 2517]CCF59712.1 hypothetical protein KAFR_0H03020 [Kazachstania africana CBS 2517]